MTAMQRASGRSAVLLLLVLTSQACSDSSGPVGPASVELSGTLPASAPIGSAVTPRVMVRDREGNPVNGAVVNFQVSAGGGALSASSSTTASTGIASPGSWTLGPTPGANTLIVKVGGVTDLVLTVQAVPIQPASVSIVEGAGQSAIAGTALSVPVRVRVADAAGNSLSGITVTFAVTGGGGTLSGGPTATDATGTATMGTWVLGTQAGPQTATASIAGGLATTIAATAVPGPPTSIAALAGNGQEAAPNALVAVAPRARVRDQHGNSVPGVGVTFEVLGGGDITTTTSTTDAEGAAGPGAWMLGPTEGAYSVRAAVIGIEPAVFTATARGAPVSPVVVHKFAGDGTTCITGSTGCSFTVQVATRVGKPVADEAITWLADGGVTLSTVSNAKGRSTAANLVTESAGAAEQRARLDRSGEEVVFGYQFVQSSQYNIDVRFVGSATASQQAIFTQAKERWEQVIIGNLPSVNLLNRAANSLCNGFINHPAINEIVDDILIFIEVVPIDGVGQTLGAAGPCLVRGTSRLPVAGVMKLDEADVGAMEANGTLYEVVLHELGHVLGIGTMWEDLGLLTGRGGSSPFFSGARAMSGFVLGGGTLINGVPVENCILANGNPRQNCGQGTRDSHWHESTFATELMTGYLSNQGNPLSAMTVASLMDLGYQVNFGAADAYALPGTTAGLQAAQAFMPELLELRELPMPRPTMINDR
jgi:hypothetical protein